MKIHSELGLADISPKLQEFWKVSGQKILNIERVYPSSLGAPVFTINGKYSTRGWTEWTQGFQYGSALLQFDATGDSEFLEIGREASQHKMEGHIGHYGVHDHGFNNVSTYGNLLRLMKEGKIPEQKWERNFYELALKLSGSVQAKRWTRIPEGGFIYSFNGPHSLFVDTIRTVRALMLSHALGYAIWEENDRKQSILERGIQHILSTAKYSVYYGEGRDVYDVWGRTAHESIFNVRDGAYRCPNSQQGYTGFSTWTRGLAWAMLGFAEQVEFLEWLDEAELAPFGGKKVLESIYLKAAKASCDFFIQHTAEDGIPYWDTGAPGLVKLGDYLNRPAEPFNDFEPVDSSAAAIGAQGLLRLGRYLGEEGKDYWQAGLKVVSRLLEEPYLSIDSEHQGLLLHSVYHRPNGWDHIPDGAKIPCGESAMWGDYHLREVVLYLHKIIKKEAYYSFWGGLDYGRSN